MAMVNWLTGPLGNAIERLLEGEGQESVNTGVSKNWDRWSQLLEDDTRLTTVISSLSTAQFNSHRVLKEAWTASQQSRASLQKTVNIACKTRSPKSILKGEPSYHSKISDLVIWEFFVSPESSDLGIFHNILNRARSEAAMFAACWRTANLFSGQSATFDQDRSTHRPPNQSPVQEQMFLHSSWKRDSRSPGATIEPCPWLTFENEGSLLPYYLWDTEKNETVIAKSITPRPNYIAISHTWGRWKTKDASVELSGVPWPIPQNTRFDVQNLPNILGSFPLKCRYLWFDLVCIPQDRSPIARTEISRQTTIFREASVAIAWLNDVKTWTDLEASVQWLCYSFLQQCSNVQKAGNFDSRNSPNLATSIEIYKPTHEQPVPSGYLPTSEINPWLTSLWTLQELCLRPDILLCNSRFELLAMDKKVPLAFDVLVALAQAYSASFIDADTLSDLQQQTPPGVQHIHHMLSQTGLEGLQQIDRPRILYLGDRRHCSRRRAEAVMAVLDATEWYTDINDESTESDLVMGQYPLRFVKEVCEKIGPASFFNFDSAENFFLPLQKKTELSSDCAVGSMIPFGSHDNGYPKTFTELPSDENVIPEPSVNTWEIETTGAVRIGKAAIVAATGHFVSSEMLSTIIGPVVGYPKGEIRSQEKVDLHSWVNEYEPSSPNYAVLLWSYSNASTGILLKELAPKILVKVGSFSEEAKDEAGHVASEIQDLDWLVL